MSEITLSKILYAEDEPDIQKIVKLSLEKFGGYEVITCNSGIDVLKKVSDFNPNLILLDVMMPEMDGLSTFEELRKIPQFSKTLIIFMTAKAQLEEIKNIQKNEMVEVISKPFDPIILSSVIRNIWETTYARK